MLESVSTGAFFLGQGTIKLAEGGGVDCLDNLLSHIGLFPRHSGRRLDMD